MFNLFLEQKLRLKKNIKMKKKIIIKKKINLINNKKIKNFSKKIKINNFFFKNWLFIF